jgi:hypothetical protein
MLESIKGVFGKIVRKRLFYCGTRDAFTAVFALATAAARMKGIVPYTFEGASSLGNAGPFSLIYPPLCLIYLIYNAAKLSRLKNKMEDAARKSGRESGRLRPERRPPVKDAASSGPYRPGVQRPPV